MSEVLGKQPRPKGPRLTMITNAGGPGVLATDALSAMGGQLAQISAETIKKLDEFLPAAWSHNNPDRCSGRCASGTLRQSARDLRQGPGSDGFLVILTPQAMTDATKIAQALEAFCADPGQTGPGQLDGRRLRRGRKNHSARNRDP